MTVTLEPDASGWVRTLTHATVSDDQKAARSELGLPTDRPVVMSGHQAGLWHAGILAKHLATNAAARTADAHAAWLVVDQDTEPPMKLAWPERDGERLVRRERDLEPGAHPDTPAAMRPTVNVADTPPAFGDIAHALNIDARSSGEQAARANATLIRDRLGTPEPTMVLATCLPRLEVFQDWLGRIADDAEACVAAYNQAVRAHPDAGIRPLIARPGVDRFELPLWRVRSGKPRRGVMADEVRTIPPEELAPRALLMTAIVRTVACDLFIHGTGGAAYDGVTEQWIGEWLGRSLAPTAVATATVRLDPARFGGVTPANEAEIARARWRAHTARHRPALVGDIQTEKRRDELVRAIDAAPWKSAERLELYKELHRLIEVHRGAHEDAISTLDTEADRLAATRADAAVASDRTWPWPLHAGEDLLMLRSKIDSAFGVLR